MFTLQNICFLLSKYMYCIPVLLQPWSTINNSKKPSNQCAPTNASFSKHRNHSNVMQILCLVWQPDAKQATKCSGDDEDRDVILSIKAGADHNRLLSSYATNHQSAPGQNAQMSKQKYDVMHFRRSKQVLSWTDWHPPRQPITSQPLARMRKLTNKSTT